MKLFILSDFLSEFSNSKLSVSLIKHFALNNSEIQLVINMNPLRNKHQIFMVQTLTTVTTELTKYLSTSNKMSIKSDSIHLVCD